MKNENERPYEEQKIRKPVESKRYEIFLDIVPKIRKPVRCQKMPKLRKSFGCQRYENSKDTKT
jgi:hypothetical protein